MPCCSEDDRKWQSATKPNKLPKGIVSSETASSQRSPNVFGWQKSGTLKHDRAGSVLGASEREFAAKF